METVAVSTVSPVAEGPSSQAGTLKMTTKKRTFTTFVFDFFIYEKKLNFLRTHFRVEFMIFIHLFCL